MILFLIVHRKKKNHLSWQRALWKLSKIFMMLCGLISLLLIWGMADTCLSPCLWTSCFPFVHLTLLAFLFHFCRENYETWNKLYKARTEGRLFSKLNWPKDAELVYISSSSPVTFSLTAYISFEWNIVIIEEMQRGQVKRLHSLLTISESAANIPKNLEARRRLEFFTNSLFMEMPKARPVREMLSFR